MSPLFSGKEWAGTRVWRAALYSITHVIESQLFQKVKQMKTERGEGGVEKEQPEGVVCEQGLTFLELGAGLGVPGLVFGRLAGCRSKDKYVITDHPSIVSQIKANVASNFRVDGNDSCCVYARGLDWSVDGVSEVIQSIPELPVKGGFDVILSTDCVYVPLYGDSYMKLAEVILECLRRNENAVSVNVVERRRLDGVAEFVDLLESGIPSKNLAGCKSWGGRVDILKMYTEEEVADGEVADVKGEKWASEKGEVSGRIEVYTVRGRGWT